MNSLAVPINDLRRCQSEDRELIVEAVNRVIESGQYILGDEVRAFEREFAGFSGVAHAIAMGNGTDALELALRVLGMGPGKRVATVANAAFYATTAVNAVGAEAVYVDVDRQSHLMDISLLRSLVEREAVDAIVVTHLYGRLHDMPTLLAIADSRGIPVIEDCAQAHGAQQDGKRAGSFGRLGCFSFYPTKNLGCFGDGGAVVTNDDTLASGLVKLRQYGWEAKYRVGQIGGRNSRLDEIQAAILRIKLRHLDVNNGRRRKIAQTYSARIRNNRVKCPVIDGEIHVAHLFVIRVAERASLMAHLAGHSIGCDIHYPIPDHFQPALRSGPVPHLPVTEELSNHVLTLPCFPGLNDAEIESVIAAVNSWTP